MRATICLHRSRARFRFWVETSSWACSLNTHILNELVGTLIDNALYLLECSHVAIVYWDNRHTSVTRCFHFRATPWRVEDWAAVRHHCKHQVGVAGMLLHELLCCAARNGHVHVRIEDIETSHDKAVSKVLKCMLVWVHLVTRVNREMRELLGEAEMGVEQGEVDSTLYEMKRSWAVISASTEAVELPPPRGCLRSQSARRVLTESVVLRRRARSF